MADNELVLLRATVRKLRSERKVMHEMLTEAGIPNDVLGDGVATCLIGRLAIAIGTGPVAQPAPTCDCYAPYGAPHMSQCAVYK